MRSNALFLAVALLLLAACGSTSNTPAPDAGGQFKDELLFGTGLDGTGFGLSGTSDSFDLTRVSTVWFRLESAANFDGRFVRLYFNGAEQKDFSGCANADAHICLSSFAVSTKGSYQVKAYLVKAVVDIGQETLVTTRTLTLN